MEEAPPNDALPLTLAGTVVAGFGRGSTELGFPTANVDPNDFAEPVHQHNLPYGVYYGWSKLKQDDVAQRMVMSLGTNPHFKNKEKTLEIHVLKTYPNKFYGEQIAFCISGWIRSMAPFDSIESLIKAIESDIQIANQKLASDDVAEITEKLSSLIK